METIIIAGIVGFIGYIAGSACVGQNKVSTKQAQVTALTAYMRGIDFAMKEFDKHGPNAIDTVEAEYKSTLQAKRMLEAA